ncbi:hypothetical protein RD792_016847 [Penstemon davidsonii]|uniref:Amino acid transporter transmembrane domain-containing protein n=1 Tax=Penstemon davidsonii TaxID=160366 RepID=A0ABR0CLN9_9LAMI|nr:hypothetical protein RD792_016847 [Penstemon davidsonii]
MHQTQDKDIKSSPFSGLLIQRCMDMDPSIRSYPDIGYRAFGPKGKIFVSIAMNIELYLVATGFLILEGDNLLNLLPEIEFQIAGLVIGGKQSFIIIVGLLMLPTVWLNNMSVLSYISVSGVIASFILFGSILWAGAFDGIGFQEKGTVLNLKGIPTAVSLYAFCYCAHPIFPTLYTSMRNQKKFSKTLDYPYCFKNYKNIKLSVTLMGDLRPDPMRFTGYARLLSRLYLELCIDGNFGVLDVWLKGHYRRFGFESVSLWGIVLIGVIVLVVGTYVAMEEIIMHLVFISIMEFI